MPSSKNPGPSGTPDTRAFRDGMIAATRARKNILKKYDNDIMCMIRRMGGTRSFHDVRRAAIAAENTLRRHRNVEAALAALIADASPLKIRVDAVRRTLAEYLYDRFHPEGRQARAAERFFAAQKRVEQLRSLLLACEARMQAEEYHGLNVEKQAA